MCIHASLHVCYLIYHQKREEDSIHNERENQLIRCLIKSIDCEGVVKRDILPCVLGFFLSMVAAMCLLLIHTRYIWTSTNLLLRASPCWHAADVKAGGDHAELNAVSQFTSLCWPACRCVSAPPDMSAESLSGDALLPLQYAGWSPEGALLDKPCTGPCACTSAWYAHGRVVGQCVYWMP